MTGVLLAGCGGSGEGTTDGGKTTTAAEDPSSPQATAPGSSESAPQKGAKQEKRSADRAPGSSSADDGSPGAQAGHRSGPSHPPKHATPNAPAEDQQPRGADRPARQHESGAEAKVTKDAKSKGAEGAAPKGIEGASPVVVAKLRKRCPKDLERSACDSLIASYIDAQDPAPAAPPAPVEAEARCPESLAQSECEAAVAAQEAAAKGGSVNVEECLAEMTPQCEAALRASFEAQKQASGE